MTTKFIVLAIFNTLCLILVLGYGSKLIPLMKETKRSFSQQSSYSNYLVTVTAFFCMWWLTLLLLAATIAGAI